MGNACKKCGAELQDGQTFCPKCGQKVGLVMDDDDSSTISQSNANVNKANQQKKPVKIIATAIIALTVIIAAVYTFSLLFNKSVDTYSVEGDKKDTVIEKNFIAYLAEGNYEKAYNVAEGNEKDAVIKENLIAYLASDIPDGLKNPESFVLRNAWYDETIQAAVLEVSATNSYGGRVPCYYFFFYDYEWNQGPSLSDLEDEKIYSWDDYNDIYEKTLNNSVRKIMRGIIGDSSLKLEKDSIKNINHLFEEDILDDVKLLDVGNHES